MTLRHYVLLVSALVGLSIGVPGPLPIQPMLAAGSAGCTPDPVLCPVRLYVGVSSPGLPGDTSALQRWSGAVAHSPSVAMSFHGLGLPLDVGGITAVARSGRLPMVTLEPYDQTAPGTDPYPLADIAAGRFDDLLRQHAAELRAVGAPVALRFAHEMNASWYPWGQGVGGHTPAMFVAAWRHVHDVMQAAGATQVVWTWAPNVIDAAPTQDLGLLYPGDAYVDWVGLSGYFDQVTDTWATVYGPTLAQLDRIAPDKPIYVAETAVLPGPTRPTMIHDLVAGLLGTRRLIGFTWFDHVTRLDWRLEIDPAASAALAADLAGGWFTSGGIPDSPVPVAPYPQDLPAPTGAPQVGVVLTGSYGTWRIPAGSSAISYAGRWYRCPDATGTSSCTATSGTDGSFVPGGADLFSYLRYQVTATNTAGSAVGWSAPTHALLMRPAQPAAPQVESRNGAVRVVFPPVAPPGTTHWRVTVAGVAQPLIPVGSRPDTYATGLTNGVAYSLALSAVSASTTDELPSAPSAGTVVPMTTPYDPYLRVDGTAGTLRLPPVPLGATGWLLSLDGVTTTVGVSTTSLPLAGLSVGATHGWSLRATAGSWPGRAYGSSTVAAQGAFAGLVAPAAPTVTTGPGSVTFALPPLPTGATSWRLSVGATAVTVAGSSSTVTVTGLIPGRSTGWALKAAQTTSSSLSTSAPALGTVTP